MYRWLKDLYSESALVPSSDSRYVRWVCARRTIVIQKPPKSEKFKQLYSCDDDPDSDFSDTDSESSDPSSDSSDTDSESSDDEYESALGSGSDSESGSESESESETNLIVNLIEFLTWIWFGLRLRLWGGFRFRFYVRF